MTTYAIATTKPWNLDAFARHRPNMPGDWHLILDPKDLKLERIRTISPDYLFFPHWSWKVPDEILNETDCILFHMTDLPYGRGGSPLQNLIANGHASTKISAIQMVSELDAGPVYLKEILDLSGTAEEIFKRQAETVMAMILTVVKNNPTAKPQAGDPTIFQRRTPDMSVLPEHGELTELYNHIRMLDAPSYPKAYLDHGDFKLEFENSRMRGDTLEARVIISAKRDTENE